MKKQCGNVFIVFSLFCASCGNIFTETLNPLNNTPLYFGSPPYSAMGVLDYSFGENGVAMVRIPEKCEDSFEEMAMDRQGNIYLVGTRRCGYGDDYDLFIRKFLSDGAVDLSFGYDGMILIDGAAGQPASHDLGISITIDKEGRLVVLASNSSIVDGETVNSQLVLRYYSDGRPDTNFGDYGVLTCNYEFPVEATIIGFRNIKIRIDSDSNIVVTGMAQELTSKFAKIYIAKHLDDGSMRTDFGTNGLIIVNKIEDSNDYKADVSSVTIDGVNDIFIAGSTQDILPTGNLSDSAMYCMKITACGVLDASFGDGGIVTRRRTAGAIPSEACDLGLDVLIDNQERVIVAGSSNNIKCNDDAVIWRFDRWGCPDRTFGTGGSVVLDNPAGVIDFSGYNEPICDYAKSLYLDKSGRILITGHSSGWTFISRLEPDGAMDPNFAYWGSLSIYTGEAWYANNDIFTDRFGKIILKSHKSVYDSAGFRSHILLWRFK